MKHKKISKFEKTEFCTNDFAERIIRIEQNVSASFHKPLKYNETVYFKSLPDVRKKSFESYLRNKKKKRIFLSILLLIPLVLFSLFKLNLTGFVVANEISQTYFPFIESLLISLFFIGLFIFLFSLLSKNQRDKRINENLDVLDTIIYKRRFK